jgi:hypothetical protein
MRILTAILLAACAASQPPAPKGGPRGLRASEHLDVARQQDEEAKTAWRWPDAMRSGPNSSNVPWVRSWDAGAEHDRIAAVHRSKADELHLQYGEACGTRDTTDVAVSPLQRHGIGGWNTSAGVILYLSPDAGPPDKLLADMKCHRAWMMLAPAGMDDCPLDLPGILIDARGDRDVITVSIVIRDPKLVGELQRRAAHDLESGRQREQPAH